MDVDCGGDYHTGKEHAATNDALKKKLCVLRRSMQKEMMRSVRQNFFYNEK